MDGEQPHLRKVPVELWEQIFAIACFSSLNTCFQYHRAEIVVILAHVCSRWRQIVIHCPRLWISIDVTRVSKGLVEMYLANSAPHLLDIQAELYDCTKRELATWEIIMGHSSRFERLLLDITDPGLLPSFRGQDTPFRNLAFFDGGYSPPLDYPDTNHPFWQALHHAPKLTEVQIASFYPRDLLPYQQLTTLALGYIDESDVEHVLLALSVSKNLQSLTLVSMAAGHPLGTMRSCVELPSLHTLSICSDINRDDWDPLEVAEMNNPILELLFTSFVLPSLSTFKLGSTRSHSNQTHWPSSLLIMLQQSSATLRHMSLSLDFHQKHHFWEPLSMLLKQTPHITHLHLNEKPRNRDQLTLPANFITSFLSNLANTRQSGNIILPELVHLALTGIEMTPAIGNTVITTAFSRRPNRLSAVGAEAICTLEGIRIMYFEPELDDDLPVFTLTPPMLEAIKRLQREGVKVVIEKLDQ